jgi:hypothetical protein
VGLDCGANVSLIDWRIKNLLGFGGLTGLGGIGRTKKLKLSECSGHFIREGLKTLVLWA